MKLGMEVGLGPGQIVLFGDRALLPKKGTALHYSAHVCCGQTPEWINTSLGTKVGLGRGHIVLDVDTAPPKKGHSPHFSTHV